MPHLWKREDAAADRPWTAQAVSSGPLYVRSGADGTGIEIGDIAGPLASQTALACLVESGRADRWVLLAGESDVRVNGRAPLGGVAILRDRDELWWAEGVRAYFSTEVLPVVEPFPHARAAKCPRCSKPIEAEMLAVCCPGCGVWHHQGERLCFTHAETCAMCQHPTQLDGGFQWYPGVLDGYVP